MSADGAVNPARVAALVLAAGGSTRLGRPKQLLDFRGEPLVTRAARIASNVGCSPVVVVTGANVSGVEAALEPLPGTRPVFNPDWASGMGSSIGVGISALLPSPVPFEAVLLLVCDQPLVSETLLLSLGEFYRGSGKKVIASEYGGVWGVPCLFDRSVLSELADLRGASGARSVIQRYRTSGEAVSVPFPGGSYDIDTPEDWAKWQDDEKPDEAD